MTLATWTDSQTEADLRARGSLKWSATAPGVIGAWVAESDLPLAPAIVKALQSAVAKGLTGYLRNGMKAGVGSTTGAAGSRKWSMVMRNASTTEATGCTSTGSMCHP